MLFISFISLLFHISFIILIFPIIGLLYGICYRCWIIITILYLLEFNVLARHLNTNIINCFLDNQSVSPINVGISSGSLINMIELNDIIKCLYLLKLVRFHFKYLILLLKQDGMNDEFNLLLDDIYLLYLKLCYYEKILLSRYIFVLLFILLSRKKCYGNLISIKTVWIKKSNGSMRKLMIPSLLLRFVNYIYYVRIKRNSNYLVSINWIDDSHNIYNLCNSLVSSPCSSLRSYVYSFDVSTAFDTIRVSKLLELVRSNVSLYQLLLQYFKFRKLHNLYWLYLEQGNSLSTILCSIYLHHLINSLRINFISVYIYVDNILLISADRINCQSNLFNSLDYKINIHSIMKGRLGHITSFDYCKTTFYYNSNIGLYNMMYNGNAVKKSSYYSRLLNRW